MVFKMYKLSRLLMFITISIGSGVFRIFSWIEGEIWNIYHLHRALKIKIKIHFKLSRWNFGHQHGTSRSIQIFNDSVKTRSACQEKKKLSKVTTTNYLFSNDLGAYASNGNNTKQTRVNHTDYRRRVTRTIVGARVYHLPDEARPEFSSSKTKNPLGKLMIDEKTNVAATFAELLSFTDRPIVKRNDRVYCW